MIRVRFKGQGESGEWFSGLLSISQGHNGQPEAGYYISNSAGMPWAYKVVPETVEVINQGKVDSRFTFEQDFCPFYDGKCSGPHCELWTKTRNGEGCSIRTGAEAMDSISETLLQILGQLKTRK